MVKAEDKIVKAVKEKFGNISRFCDIVGLSYDWFMHTLRWPDEAEKEKRIKVISNLVQTHEDVPASYEIDDDLIEKIRIEILKRCRTYGEFCNKYDFNNAWLSRLINGHCRYKSVKVKQLCKTLGINNI